MKTAISMPDDLYQAVVEHAAGRKFSTTICDLIRQALYGNLEEMGSNIPQPDVVDKFKALEERIAAIEVREVIPEVSPGITNEISERMQDLTNRIVVLEVASKLDGDYIDHIDARLNEIETLIREGNKIEAGLIEVIPDVIPEVIPEQPDRAEEEIVIPIVQPEIIPDKELITNAAPAAVTLERITLTEEMKIQLTDQVKKLLESGMKYPKISSITGVSESTLKKIKNKLLGKTLEKSMYDAVMSL